MTEILDDVYTRYLYHDQRIKECLDATLKLTEAVLNIPLNQPLDRRILGARELIAGTLESMKFDYSSPLSLDDNLLSLMRWEGLCTIHLFHTVLEKVFQGRTYV